MIALFVVLLKYLFLAMSGFMFIFLSKESFLEQNFIMLAGLWFYFIIYFCIGYFLSTLYLKNDLYIELRTSYILIPSLLLTYLLLFFTYKPTHFFDIVTKSEYLGRLMILGIVVPLFPLELSKYVALFVANRRYDKQLDREIEARNQLRLKQEKERLAKEQEEKEHKALEKRYMEHMLSQENGSTSKYDELKKLSDLKNEGIISEEEYLAEKSKLLG